MAEVTLKAMGLMKYDAVALGPQDLLLGPNPLKALLSAERLPVAASNLVSGETGAPFEKPYVLVEKEGIRVGILSVMPLMPQEDPERNPFLKPGESPGKAVTEPAILPAFRQSGRKTGREAFKILSPEESVEKAVQEIRERADLIVLLSQAGYDETCDLVNRIPGIDLAVYSRAGKNTPGKKSMKTLLMRAPSEGDAIGFAKFAFNKGGKAVLREHKRISLSCSSREPDLPEDPAVAALLGEDFERKLVELQRDLEKQREAELMREARELWKLSPREFLEMQTQKEAGKNEPAARPPVR